MAKLSEIKGDAVLDVIAEILTPVANIAADPNAQALFKKQAVDPGTDVKQAATARLLKGLPVLIRDHKADIIAILAAVNQTTPEEYAEGLTLMSLFHDAADLVSDEAFGDFFTSSVSTATAPASTSTSFAAAV